jgi:hypothetical protein
MFVDWLCRKNDVCSTVVVSKEEPGDDMMRRYVMTEYSAQRDSHPDSPLVSALQVGTHFKIKKGGINIRIDNIQEVHNDNIPTKVVPLSLMKIAKASQLRITRRICRRNRRIILGAVCTVQVILVLVH